MDDNGANESLTIDELARRTGMTVRNLRAHQSRGLLPPPEVRGRTGYYGEDHVARVELIKELQADGYPLDLIGRILEGAGSSSEVLRFTRAVRAPFGDEQPQIVDGQELAQRWQTTDAETLQRAEELGLLRPLGDGRYEEISPKLARAGDQLRELGIPVEEALEVVERLRAQADRAAKTFVRLFITQIWKPFEEAGAPEERWPEVRDALERLRPLAAESLLAVFQMAMDDAVERAFGRELKRLRRELPRRR